MDYELTYSYSNNAYTVTGCTGTPVNVVIPDTYNGPQGEHPVTEIANIALWDKDSLESVVIGDNVSKIGSGAFMDDPSLRSITIGNGVVDIGVEAFRDCTCEIVWGNNPSITVIKTGTFTHYNGTSLTIPDSVLTIQSDAFSCPYLTNLTLGSGVANISSQALTDLPSLINIEVSDNNANYKSIDGNLYSKDESALFRYAPGKLSKTFVIPSMVSDISDAFEYCNNLVYMEIPSNVQFMHYAFFHCSSLKSVIIDDGVTSVSTYAFYSCASLTSVTIPESVTSIGSHSFASCNSLESLIIGSGVTSIGWYAFMGCESLTTITIPDSVTNIESYAFLNCRNLSKVVLLPKTPPTIRSDSFSNISNNVTFYCFQDAGYNYEHSTNWSSLASKFVADDLSIYFILNAESTKNYIKDFTHIKLDKVTTANKIYGTDENGDQITYDRSSFDTADNIENGAGVNSLIQKAGSGEENTAAGENAIALGKSCNANNIESMAQGYITTANGNYSHAEGFANVAHADISHTEGQGNVVGDLTQFIIRNAGIGGHAEGYGNLVLGEGAHAEGANNVAKGQYSHASGIGANDWATPANSEVAKRLYDNTNYIRCNTYGAGLYSGGGKTIIMAQFSDGTQTYNAFKARLSAGDTLLVVHSTGAKEEVVVYDFASNSIRVNGTISWSTGDTYLIVKLCTEAVTSGTAYGIGSSVGGFHNCATKNYQTVVGKYNDNKDNTLFEVGNGTSNNSRNNALEVLENGVVRSGASKADIINSKDLTTKEYADDLKVYEHTVSFTDTPIKFKVKNNSSAALQTSDFFGANRNNYFAQLLLSTALYPSAGAPGCAIIYDVALVGVTVSGAFLDGMQLKVKFTDDITTYTYTVIEDDTASDVVTEL